MRHETTHIIHEKNPIYNTYKQITRKKNYLKFENNNNKSDLCVSAKVRANGGSCCQPLKIFKMCNCARIDLKSNQF